MTIIRRYRCTIATKWYDDTLGRVREVEMHFVLARRGPIRTNRRRLANRGTIYLQREAFRRYGKWVTKPKLRINFEREEPARKVDHKIVVYPRTLHYRGSQHTKQNLSSRLIPLRAVKDELGVPSYIVRALNKRHQQQERHRREIQRKLGEIAERMHRKAMRNAA
jgi:hypothetical protein